MGRGICDVLVRHTLCMKGLGCDVDVIGKSDYAQLIWNFTAVAIFAVVICDRNSDHGVNTDVDLEVALFCSVPVAPHQFEKAYLS